MVVRTTLIVIFPPGKNRSQHLAPAVEDCWFKQIKNTLNALPVPWNLTGMS